VGVSAHELAERARALSRRDLDPEELERWLVAEGFAVESAGLLLPTRSAIAVGGVLGPTTR
jgi:hypothetical protein